MKKGEIRWRAERHLCPLCASRLLVPVIRATVDGEGNEVIDVQSNFSDPIDPSIAMVSAMGGALLFIDSGHTRYLT